jgi:hypothetical protein
MALNFHIHTPICNPSRSELLSGRYFHNIKAVGGPVWSMHVNEERVNAATFAASLKQAGYTCGMVRIAQPGSPCALRRSRLLRWHRGTVRQIHEHYAQQCAARLGRLARQPRGRLHLPQLPNTGPDRARVRCRPEHGSGGTLRRREAIWWGTGRGLLDGEPRRLQLLHQRDRQRLHRLDQEGSAGGRRSTFHGLHCAQGSTRAVQPGAMVYLYFLWVFFSGT